MKNMYNLISEIITFCVPQWLKRRRKDQMILTSRVQISPYDVGAGPSDEAIKTEVLCHCKWGL
jgi:hypothetical protein